MKKQKIWASFVPMRSPFNNATGEVHTHNVLEMVKNDTEFFLKELDLRKKSNSFKVYFYLSFSYYIFLFPSSLILLRVYFSKIFESFLRTINSRILVKCLKILLEKFYKILFIFGKILFQFFSIFFSFCAQIFHFMFLNSEGTNSNPWLRSWLIYKYLSQCTLSTV